MKKLITVYGMTCENCRRSIIMGLEKVEGIQAVSVRMTNSIVEVDFDDTMLTLDDIKKHIHSLGYDPK